MNNRTDVDNELGLQIGQLLRDLEIENPIMAKFNEQLISHGIKLVLDGLGLDSADNAIAKTPSRVAEFFCQELFYGLDYANFPKASFTPNLYNYHEPVFAKDILFKSTCEHHLVAIIGKAQVAYIPKQQVIGLSKINRIVDFFASRPQMQERVTLQIFHALKFILQTDDIAIMIKANHHCVTMRGVNDREVENITYQFGGAFANPDMRRDFLQLCNPN